MEQQLEQLAAQMGVTVGDVRGFVACLQVWIAKGYSFEDAIAAHMRQMEKLASGALRLDARSVGELYDSLRAAAK